MLKIIKINSKSEFDNYPAPVLFEDKISNRAFALLANGLVEFKISWASDLLMPEITLFDEGIYGVGIDQNFSILDTLKGKVYLSLDLSYTYLQTYINRHSAYVITEMEVLKFDKSSFGLLKKYDLPELLESIEFIDTSAIVKCFGGTCIEIEL